ncbi:Serine/threonine-protein kinase C [Hyella patelloides LEGE 07179]|uniref:non-specific serine/threonine protein kinase n=1 Tax=Hyella patelloides LEGE 07179 TaxID=945734 RepID=A0A563W4A7_9CYAN|nr:serine/threonine-protein kinase [Hyella patelloides]VEP18477.1 Serine/threonine-protein kinase C [Hyella patelloides LEGE 07179]
MTEMMNAALINNRYRILETLGRGGFGETYLVQDMHMPSRRKCVLKQLKPIVQQPSIPLWMKERFQREAAILEKLGAASPQIPELYAYFSENGQFYLVQEWIEGETLAQKWQRQGNLTAEEVIRILTQIIPVLDFIHSRKIVHRDIKPENIILRSDNFSPVLIDFGAVKEAVATTVKHNSNSAYSAAIGTPGYMPSEQAAGRPLYSSDLYSLGLTAIFLLTGKTPQELEIDSQTGEIIWQQYAQDVDPQLVEILNQTIRFHPRDRFSQAREMLIALQPNTNHHKSGVVTGATVNVSPAVSPRSHKNFGGTVVYKEPQSGNQKKGNWLSKVFLFFLVTGGLTVSSFVAGFYALSNWWQSRNQPSPQVQVEPNVPEPVLFPPETENTEQAKKETEEPIKVGDLEKPKKEEPEATEELEVTEETNTPEETDPTPEVVVQPKLKPKNKPQPQADVPIVTTGTSENQLVSTLGKPSSRRNEPQRNSQVLTYNNATSNNINLTYHSDSNGRIKQANATLNQDLTLGAMQETLTELLGGNASADARNKLRDVYSRQASLQSFRVGELQGRIQRDSKDRVNISVWELGY